jgi:hypothetical protein
MDHRRVESALWTAVRVATAFLLAQMVGVVVAKIGASTAVLLAVLVGATYSIGAMAAMIVRNNRPPSLADWFDHQMLVFCLLMLAFA